MNKIRNTAKTAGAHVADRKTGRIQFVEATCERTGTTCIVVRAESTSLRRALPENWLDEHTHSHAQQTFSGFLGFTDWEYCFHDLTLDDDDMVELRDVLAAQGYEVLTSATEIPIKGE